MFGQEWVGQRLAKGIERDEEQNEVWQRTVRHSVFAEDPHEEVDVSWLGIGCGKIGRDLRDGGNLRPVGWKFCPR